jgi:hypothetical protein
MSVTGAKMDNSSKVSHEQLDASMKALNWRFERHEKHFHETAQGIGHAIQGAADLTELAAIDINQGWPQ